MAKASRTTSTEMQRVTFTSPDGSLEAAEVTDDSGASLGVVKAFSTTTDLSGKITSLIVTYAPGETKPESAVTAITEPVEPEV